MGARHKIAQLLMAVIFMGIWCPFMYAREIAPADTVCADSVALPLSPIEKFLKSHAINASTTSVWIEDLANGEILASANEDLPLIPASTMKAVTSAALFDKADMDERFITNVYLTGAIDSGALQGNLIVVGSGDPTLNSDVQPRSADFNMEILRALKAKGINKINGKLIIDNSVCSGPATPFTWSDSNRRQYYGTGVHGFNYQRNKSGSSSVASPSDVFSRHLSSIMHKEGIEMANENVSDSLSMALLTSHKSPPLDEIIRSCMMRSDNMYAESLLRLIGIKVAGTGSLQNSLQAMRRHWEQTGLETKGTTICDGSGLSRSNRLTARFLAEVLRLMHSQPYYASFFPLAGEEGTLRGFLKGTQLAGYVAMKTGSMNGVQSYAGYLLDENYKPTHVIVILMNNFSSRDGARKAAENLLIETFTSNK